jgi:hypothetical protein
VKGASSQSLHRRSRDGNGIGELLDEMENFRAVGTERYTCRIRLNSPTQVDLEENRGERQALEFRVLRTVSTKDKSGS